MVFITLAEIFDLVVMTFGVGIIFTGMFQIPVRDVLNHSQFREIMISTLIAAPGIVFHELAHKMVAMAFGLAATFHAHYTFLMMGIVMKYLLGWVVFVPGYVSISGASSMQSAISAFAGPATNLALALLSMAVLRYKKGMAHSTQIGLIISQKLNFFLFGFNMIPLPPFDGFTVVMGLFHAIQGAV